MDKEEQLPQKRFQQYEQVFDNDGNAIGFKLSGNDFLFKYDQKGNWKDEKGNVYNTKGIQIKKYEQDSDEDDEQNNEQMVDQFEKMLEDEDKGIPRGKNKIINKKKQQHQNYHQDLHQLLNHFINKENLRAHLTDQLFIFFKSKTKYYQQIHPQVQKIQNNVQANKQIDKIKNLIQQKIKTLKDKNKWIEQNNALFQYSGTQLGQGIYDRYWYGLIKATPDNYISIIDNIAKSQQFVLLQHKTFYALKSKFYLKKKMPQTIKQLSQKINEKLDDQLVKIQINNLPQNVPCSFILDLCTFSNTPIQQIFSIDLIDQYNADLVISKKGALKFLNIQGYCHDDKQFIQLNIRQDQSKDKLIKTSLYKIGIQTDKNIPYKVHTRQLHDTLALGKSRQQLAKLFSQEEQKKNGGFRFVVGINALKKVLMFRGSSLNVLKIEVFIS